MANNVKKPRTYLPPDVPNREELNAFVQQMEHLANEQATLRSADGQEVLLPAPLFDVLRRVAESLASGRGVSVVPRETRLTTQEAADYLGVSRPTLIKLLEQERIRYELVGRHRKVFLRDLDTYRDGARASRRAILRRSAREDQAAGLHELTTSEMPPRA